MSLKRRLSFEELVKENRKQIVQDQLLMEKIEQNIEMKRNKSVKRVNEM
ncbi:FbpB family small basic protein [Virgibacillus sp. FSP13]